MSSPPLPPPPPPGPPDDESRRGGEGPPSGGSAWGGQGWGSQPGGGQGSGDQAWPPSGGGQGWSDPGGGWGAPPGQTPYGGPGGYGPGHGQRKRTNGLALAAMICGIVSIGCLLLFFLIVTVPLAVALSIAAIITGILGLRAARDPNVGGRGQAIAGIATGGVALALVLFLTFGLIAAWQSTGFESNPIFEPEEFLSELEDRGIDIEEEGGIDPEELRSELERDRGR